MKKITLFLFLISALPSCGQQMVEEVKPDPSVSTAQLGFSQGADVSWITQMEAEGRKFYDRNGKETECFTLLKSLGMNSIRLRVWVNPLAKYNATADVVAKAKRAQALGFRLMIDFHYSDDWADPEKQTKPSAWRAMDIEGLKRAVYLHTFEVLSELKKNGIAPEWVQVGNETNDGMLWPEGRASVNMGHFAGLINAGYAGAKAIFPQAKVIVHISNGYDNKLFRWMFDGLTQHGAQYDVIGMSLYPFYANEAWQTVNQKCFDNMKDMVARYNKEVMIVEVGMRWDQPQECKLFLEDLLQKTKSVASQKGLGVLYWEPQAYNNWVGYSLGAFDNKGRPTIALDAFKK